MRLTKVVPVVDPRANRPPTARLSVRPDPPRVGELVTLDGSASTDPDSYDRPVGELSFTWTLIGEAEVERVVNQTPGDGGERVLRIRYPFSGVKRVSLRVADAFGRADTVTRTFTVPLLSEGENRPPTARLTVTPNPARATREIRVDASASSDPEGPIARV